MQLQNFVNKSFFVLFVERPIINIMCKLLDIILQSNNIGKL